MMTQVDSNHRGPLINIATWITLVAMIIFSFSKVVTKWALIRRLQSDDIFMTIATCTAVGYCVAVSKQVQSGLGQPGNKLTGQQFHEFEKSEYVSQMFYILTIFMTKIASLKFQLRLARPGRMDRLHLRTTSVRCTMLFVAAWTVVALLVSIFQCGLPHPWAQTSARCINQLAFWITNGVIDIITQILTGLMPIYLLYNIQLPKAHKRVASMSFTPGLSTIPLAIIRLIYFQKAHNSSTTTASSFDFVLVTVIQANLSVIASCLTFLKPLVDSLSIGLMTNDIRVPLGSDNLAAGMNRINPFSFLGGRETSNAQHVQRGTWSPTSGGKSTSAATAADDHEFQLEDLEQHSLRNKMVIKQTKTTDVFSYPKLPPKIPTRFPSEAQAGESTEGFLTTPVLSHV